MRQLGFRQVALALLLSAAGQATFAAPPDVREQEARRQALDHYRQGQYLLQSEGWAAAEREFQEAVRLDPIFALAYHDLGLCEMGLKNYPAAVKAFLDSREAFKKLWELRTSDAGQAELRLDEEIRELQDSVHQAEQSKLSNAWTVMKIQDRIRSLEAEKKRGVGGTFEVPAEVSLGLGSAYLRMGQLEEAEKAYQEAVKVRPKFGEAHNNLAVIYLKTGHIPEAEQEVKLAEKAGFKVPPGLKEDIKRAAHP